MQRKLNKKVVQLRPKKKPLFPPLVFVAILVMFIVGLLIFQFFNVPTYIVKQGVIEDSFTSDAVVLKNETTITSPVDGDLFMLVESGERVRVGTPIFAVITDVKQKQKYEQEVAEIKEKIKVLEEQSDSSLPISLINKSIESTTDKLQDVVKKGEFDKVKTLKDELSQLNEEKQKNIDLNVKNVEVLRNNIKELEDKLKEVELVVYAPVSGILSYHIDGLEDLLAPEQAKNLSFKELESIKGKPNAGQIPTHVRANQNVVKIVDNFTWYLALEAKKELDEGKHYNLKFTDIDEKIKAKLITINDNTTPIGIFSINKDLQNLIDSRRVEVEIILKTYTGHLIPIEAIVSSEEGEGVYVKEKKRAKYKAVKIIAQNETCAIVEGLKLGDKIRLK